MTSQSDSALNRADFLPQETARESALHEALMARAPISARIYSGAIATLRHEPNPDRFALAAHGFREMMRKFPEELTVSVCERGHKMGDKVITLCDRWKKMLGKTRVCKNGAWTGEVDAPLGRLLKHMAEFVTWFDNHQPRRKEETAAFLARIDGNRQRLPAVLEGLNTGYWQSIHDFFVKVAHHNCDTTEREMQEWKYALEDFLMQRLHPRTFADVDQIDALIGK